MSPLPECGIVMAGRVGEIRRVTEFETTAPRTKRGPVFPAPSSYFRDQSLQLVCELL